MAYRKQFLIECLHVFVLTGFAVAQPVYDLLGKHPEFFVAHKADWIEILWLCAILSFAVPGLLCLIVLVMRPFGDQVRRYVHAGIVGFLISLIFLPLFGKLWSGGIFHLALAVLAGGVFGFIYQNTQAFRMFLSILGPVVLIFPAWFVFMTPVARIVLPQSLHVPDKVEIGRPAPVFIVIFDELHTTSLLDETLQIDSVRFSNFAHLAEHGFWFPNAVGPHYQTMHALPAILTGNNPRPSAGLNPTAVDHPGNLFTLLGKEYEINALEAQTMLCPEDICQVSAQHAPAPGVFFMDIGIIFLHLTVPDKLSTGLPSLDAQWTGFADVHQDKRDAAGAQLQGRTGYFTDFVSNIQHDSANQMHFLHVLLPHIPYEYLSTGHTYNRSINHGLPEGIRDEASGWSEEIELIKVAYHQYLQQVGFADKLLGILIERLREHKIFEQSLIIVTADHGLSFKPGKHRRVIDSETFSDILKVPLLVKLPGQNEGQVSKKLVSGIDILPTIADVLDFDLWWEVDGVSLFSDEFSRSKIEIPGAGFFSAEEISGFPGLDWQIHNYGSRTSLDSLLPRGLYPECTGKDISRISIEDSEKLRFNSDIISYFQSVSSSEGFLPALFSGKIVGTLDDNLLIAIALNDQIWATTRTSKWLRTEHYFSALFPAAAFREGDNRVDVLVIEERGNGCNLLRIPVICDGSKEPRVSKTDGTLTIVLESGAEIAIDAGPTRVIGFVDELIYKDRILHIRGWTGDTNFHPAESIYIFLNDKHIAKTVPQQARADVASHFGLESIMYSGFQASIPIDFLDFEERDNLWVIAVTNDGSAGKLDFTKAVKQ